MGWDGTSGQVLVVRIGMVVGFGCAGALTPPASHVADVGGVGHVAARPSRSVVGQSSLGPDRGSPTVHRVTGDSDESPGTAWRRHSSRCPRGPTAPSPRPSRTLSTPVSFFSSDPPPGPSPPHPAGSPDRFGPSYQRYSIRTFSLSDPRPRH